MKFRGDTEVLATYVEEVAQRMCEIETGLLALESGERVDADAVHAMFRCAHSVKAGANLLELSRVERLAHELENGLQELRGGARADQERVTRLLEAVDEVRSLVTELARAELSGMDVSLAGLRPLGER